MKTANRQTQHKQAREERKTKEVQTLKRENHKLARDNARLQKQLTRALQVRGEFEEGDNGEEPAVKPPELPGDKCPDCDSESVRKVNLAGRDYYICANCKWRSPAQKLTGLPPKPDEQ